MLGRPEKNEYSTVYKNSIEKVPDGNLIEILERQMDEVLPFLGSLNEEQAGYRYAPGKWSIKEVVGHMTDSERVFSYRALRFARYDGTELPGYDENEYVDRANFDVQSLGALIEEFRAVRMASLTLFRSFDDPSWLRKGTASGYEFSVRALAYQMAGHVVHHVGIIKERYL
jgi:hypothetical protein